MLLDEKFYLCDKVKYCMPQSLTYTHLLVCELMRSVTHKRHSSSHSYFISSVLLSYLLQSFHPGLVPNLLQDLDLMAVVLQNKKRGV